MCSQNPTWPEIRLSKRYLAVSGVLLVVGYLLNYLPLQSMFPLLFAVYILMRVLPAVQAYQNDGFLLLWVLASAPMFTFISGIRGDPAAPEHSILFSAGAALLLGAIPDGIGCLIGVSTFGVSVSR